MVVRLGIPAAALGSTLLAILYAAGFDYHVVEPIFWGLIVTASGHPARILTPFPAVGWAAGLALAAALIFNGSFYVVLKLDQHQAMAFNLEIGHAETTAQMVRGTGFEPVAPTMSR